MLTSATGATSLLTIPLMIQFGVGPREAIATNMVLLVLMNIGSSTGFHGEHMGTWTRVTRLSIVTAAGSLAGALLLLAVPNTAVRLAVPCAMVGVMLFLLFGPRRPQIHPVSIPRLTAGYGVVTLLGIYGGFLSAGYVTLLVAACTWFFAYPFLRAIALSRFLNIVSSAGAVAVFAWSGTINWQLGLSLGGFAFAGAFLGARLARRLSEIWLRRIFVAAVAILAVKSVLFDL